MATQTNINVNQQAPYIEEYGQGVLADALGKNIVGADGKGLTNPDGSPQRTSGFLGKGYQDYGALTGRDRVAGFNQDQLDAQQLGRDGIGAYQPALTQANAFVGAAPGSFGAAAADGANYLKSGAEGTDISSFVQDANSNMSQGIGAYGQNAQGARDLVNSSAQYGDLQQFMNPYQQSVTDATMGQMRREGEMDQDRLDAQAAKAGAFGGSRHGVAEAEMYSNQERNRGQVLAQMNQANFGNAQQAQEAWRNRQGNAGNQLAGIAGTQAGLNMTAAQQQGQLGSLYATTQSDQFNRMQNAGQQIGALGQAGANLNLDAGKTMATLGGLSQQYRGNDMASLSGIGSQNQQLDQVNLDTDYNNWLDQQNQPYKDASFATDLLRGVPSSQSSVGSVSTPDKSKLAQVVGGIGSLAGTGQQFGWWGQDSNSTSK